LHKKFGRPHLKNPSSLVRNMSARTTPSLLEYGRPLWTPLNKNNSIVVIGLSRTEQDVNLTVNAKLLFPKLFPFNKRRRNRGSWEEIAVAYIRRSFCKLIRTCFISSN